LPIFKIVNSAGEKWEKAFTKMGNGFSFCRVWELILCGRPLKTEGGKIRRYEVKKPGGLRLGGREAKRRLNLRAGETGNRGNGEWVLII
jgi:hypothetical protein